MVFPKDEHWLHDSEVCSAGDGYHAELYPAVEQQRDLVSLPRVSQQGSGPASVKMPFVPPSVQHFTQVQAAKVRLGHTSGSSGFYFTQVRCWLSVATKQCSTSSEALKNCTCTLICTQRGADKSMHQPTTFMLGICGNTDAQYQQSAGSDPLAHTALNLLACLELFSPRHARIHCVAPGLSSSVRHLGLAAFADAPSVIPKNWC